VRGVNGETFYKVLKNLDLLQQHKVPHYFNSVITKFNTEEFIDQTYFEKAIEFGSDAVSLTFVEDRSDVNYSLLPDRKTMNRVCESILDYSKRKTRPRIMIPDLYFKQILENGHVLFDECGVWKSVFVNGDGSVLVPCWKFKGSENTYNLLSHSIDEIWSAPQWDIAKNCHDCKVLGCIWYSSQPITTFVSNYMQGLSQYISHKNPEIKI
jgi:sulfatase maturation enzyme AslB (radical SAM superfamily)